jgi:hypothetical protein
LKEPVMINKGGVVVELQHLLKCDPATLNEEQLEARTYILKTHTPEEAELYYSAECDEDYRHVWKMMDERRARERIERRQKSWQSSEAGQALKRFREAFLEYKACLDGNPAPQEAMEFDELGQRIFERLRTNIAKAHNAPRCGRIMASGRRCRAPRVRGKKLCHMHQAMEEARPQKIDLPSLDNANDIQLAIARIAQALVDGKLEPKQASTLSYVLQLAISNVGRLDFEPEDFEEEAEGQ